MSVNIITTGDRPPLQMRLGRLIVSGGGCLLVIAGALLTVPLMIVIVLFILSGKLDQDADALRQLALFTIAGALALIIGFRMMRGRRRLVLYLRKFGFTTSTQALTYAISRATGRRWRLVTLDDSATEPYGVSPARRLLYRLGKWILIIVLAFAIFRIAVWLKSDPGHDTFSETFNHAFANAREQGTNVIGAAIGAAIAAFFVTFIVLLFALILIVVPTALLGTTTVFAWVSERAVRRAERAKKATISRPGEIQPVIERINRKTRRIFAPRLIVARVANPIWQQVIRAIDDVTDYIIIDISNPTENLLWEVKTIQGQPSNIAVYIGQLDHLGYLLPDAHRTPLEEELVQRLDGRHVLAYIDTGKRSMHNFAHALQAVLENKGYHQAV